MPLKLTSKALAVVVSFLFIGILDIPRVFACDRNQPHSQGFICCNGNEVPIGQECPANGGGGGTANVKKPVITLLEPIGLCTTVEELPGFGLFWAYFQCFYPWLVGTAAGIALLMIVYAGSTIILNAGDSTERTNQLERIKWAILGLLMIAFSSMVLQAINPSFFVN